MASSRAPISRRIYASCLAACLFTGAGLLLACSRSSSSDSVIFDQSLKGNGKLSTNDTDVCHLDYQPSGFVIANIAANSVCDDSLTEVGSLLPHVRIEVTVALQKGTTESIFGIYFGEAAGTSHPHFHLNITAKGQFDVEFVTVGGKAVPATLTTAEIPAVPDTRAIPFSWRDDASIQKGIGAQNTLAVEISGARAHFFINEKDVGSILAPKPIEGHMGFSMSGFGGEAVFSSLRVTNIPAN
jgi:hypothetical protein